MEAIITLTTDFGIADAYVAAMKGVMLGINPRVKLVDICHSIQPGNIQQAAFILSTAHPFFPLGTVHVVVVDPGVGTERCALILRTPAADFVAPDNGVLSYVIEPFSAKPDEYSDSYQINLPPELEGVAINRPEYWRTPVSPTFHGRDIFAPVAARLSLGLSPRQFGESAASVTMLPRQRPHLEKNGLIVGGILHIDSFGNLITNIRDSDLPQAKEITVEVSGHVISGLSRTYAEAEGLLALIGSSGYLEIALPGDSAARFLKAKVGNIVRVRAGSGPFI